MAGSVTDKLITLGELKMGLDTKVDTSAVQDIAHGGTNASTATDARTNLDVYSKSETDDAIAQSTASFGLKSWSFTIANNASYNITASIIFVVSVKNAASDQIMGGVVFASFMGDVVRKNPIQNPGMFELSYSNGVYTITNTGGMYQTFMVLYR